VNKVCIFGSVKQYNTLGQKKLAKENLQNVKNVRFLMIMKLYMTKIGGCRDHICMVVGFTTISAYHH
jgi:hypothetical protein